MRTITERRSIHMADIYHITMTVMLLLGMLLIFTGGAAATCTTDLSNIPLDTMQQKAPGLVMFLIDDSGSMDWSVMTNESDGTFDGYYYVFDDPGDNAYYGHLISGTERRKWESQWAGYNHIYYDPSVTYTPWPHWENVSGAAAPTWNSAPNADPNTPRSNPLSNQYTLNLDNTYYDLDSGGIDSIINNNTQGIVIVDDSDTSGNGGNVSDLVVDDSDPGFQWGNLSNVKIYHWTDYPGFEKNDYYSIYPYSSYDRTNLNGTWTFNVDTAGPYQIWVSIPMYNTRTRNASYIVKNGGNTWRISGVSQNNKGGLTRKWVQLVQSGGIQEFQLSAGTATVGLHYRDYTTDTFGVDAVKLAYKGSSDGGGTPDVLFSSTGPWNLSSGKRSFGYNNNYHYTNNNDIGNVCTATWTANNLDTSQSYDVYVYYDFNTSHPPTCTISDGTTKLLDAHPAGLNGGQWNLIASNQSFSSGQGAVSINVTPSDWYTYYYADAVAFVPHGLINNVNVVNAHYFEQNNSGTFLVNLDGAIDYYQFNDKNGNNVVDPGELKPLTPDEATADGIVTGRTYAKERQNFANWYSFYRRRISTLKSAIGQVINGFSGVEAGIFTINKTLMQPVLPVNVTVDNKNYDQSGDLLQQLYGLSITPQNTPLRQGLINVGQYFEGKYLNEPNSSDTADFTSSATYPFFTSDKGGSCQQAFCIVSTDGYYNQSITSSEKTTIGNQDSTDCGTSKCDKFSDTVSHTLADIAMYYYVNDLNGNLDDNVPINAYDRNTKQHMVTYILSFGLNGTLDRNNTAWSTRPQGDCPPWPDDWNPDDTSSQPQKIDDLWHAAVDGRGQYISAGNANAVVQAMLSFKQNIENRIGSAASLATNSIQRQVGSVIYQGLYHTDNWYGDVTARTVDVNTGQIMGSAWKDAGGQDITAKSLLDSVAATDRIVFTDNDGAGVPFRYSDLNAAQKADLSSDPTTAAELVPYLRGDPTHNQANGGPFRNLSARIGDVVHSAPTYYNGVIYIGANDGMMHAFDAATGNELFAYVPNVVFPNLSKLADPGYTHQYYVDNTPYVHAIKTSSGNSKILLVGGLRKGGKGYYCLNVTNPRPESETEAARMFMWEYSAGGKNDPDMGYSYSQAFIADTTAGWAVIFGNGYGSESGRAALYILNATDGSVIKEIPAGAGGDCNGLSTPAVIDVDGDGIVDYVYAGDLMGDLWKFDLTGSSDTWKVAYESADGTPEPLFQAKNAAGQIQPITESPDVMGQWDVGLGGYIVVFGTGKYLGDSDFSNTDVQTLYGIWDWQDAWADKTGNPDAGTTKYFGSFTNANPRTLSNISGNASLSANAQQVTLLQQTVVSDNGTYGVISNNPMTYYDPSTDSGKYVGWYFNLPTPGERSIRDPIIENNVALFVSSIPASSPCAAGGSSVIYQLNAFSGGWTDQPQFDVNNDGVYNSEDNITLPHCNKAQVAWKHVNKMLYDPIIMGNRIYMNDASGDINIFPIPYTPSGIYYWRVVKGNGF